MVTITYTQGVSEYTIGSGLGCWASSIESVTINNGDVRLIKGILMYAYNVIEPKWYQLTGNIVWWVPVDKKYGHDFENLRKWTNEFY